MEQSIFKGHAGEVITVYKYYVCSCFIVKTEGKNINILDKKHDNIKGTERWC